MKMKFKRFVSIPVTSVLLVLGFVYYVTVFVFIENWVSLQSSAGSLNALIFSFLACNCLFSFFIAVLTDPGYVPSNFVPDVEDRGDVSDQQSNKTQCDKCRTYKPPRAHHCRVCRKCILKMDHHCMWINNCVGHRNYKAFFILVFYATIASIYSLIMIILCALGTDWDFNQWTTLMIFNITCGILIVAMIVTLGTLLGWHIYLISQNMTTIEHYESIRAAWFARKSGQMYHHRFNISVYRNITLILGPNMLKWLCPMAISHLKDGTSFPTSRDSS